MKWKQFIRWYDLLVGMLVVNASTWRARVAVQEAHDAAGETATSLQQVTFDARYASEDAV